MTNRTINYSKRDFVSLKQEQVNYVKQYYPNLLENFNDASILSVLLDLNAAIADNLHYHIDRTLQETILDFAQERKSLFNIAKTYGLKLPAKSASVAICQFSIQVPVYGDGEDVRYLPILYAGSQFNNGSITFELLYDVDFSSNVNIANKVDRTKVPIFVNGVLSGYRVTKTGIVISGVSKLYTQIVSATKPFFKITLPENNVLSIESVIHKSGTTFQSPPTNSEFNSDINKWYEVDALAENMVFSPIKGMAPVNGIYKGEYITIDRRFVKEYTPTGFCTLTFGAQTDSGLDILDDYMNAGSFDLRSVMNNLSLGMAPIPNTTLYVRYRVGGGSETNVGINTINNIGQLIIKSNGPDNRTKTIVQSSLTVTNITPSIGGGDAPSIEELRQFISYNFSAQNRAVTLQDYKSILMGMPVKFGTPSKISVSEVNNKININVLTNDENGELSNLVTSVIMENIAAYLARYRMINDYVVVKPAEIINLGFEVSVLVEDGTQISVTTEIINQITAQLSQSNLSLGQNIYVGNIIKELSQITGLLNISYIKAYNKIGGEYSDVIINTNQIIDPNTYEIDISNGMIEAKDNQIFQIKLPDQDIIVIPVVQNFLI